MKHKFLLNIMSLLTPVVIGFGAMPFSKTNVVYADSNNRYGDIYWSIEGSTLRISPVPGTDGAMADITSYDEAPWYWYNNKYSCDYIKSIIIEDGVSHIGTEAFCYFDKITRIDIPRSCKTVSREAFYNCENLKEVTMYGNVGVLTFAYCYNLEKVTVISNEPGQFIADSAFYDCESLKEVTIQVQDILEDAFAYCYALENVTILEDCINIKNEAFYKCQSLKNLYLPSTLRSIEREAFYDCRSLETVTYNGTKTDFISKVDLDTDYNDVIVDSINLQNGRKIIYKANGIYNYIDASGNTKTVDGSKENCFYLTTITTELKDDWYIVDGKLDFDTKEITVNGYAKILLLNNCEIDHLDSFYLLDGSSIEIYSETLVENKMGIINIEKVYEWNPGPGIGNILGNAIITICGGNINVKNNYDTGIGSYGKAANAIINIYGGNINATGGVNSPGIGSGKSCGMSRCTATVNIYGGNVTSRGGTNGAGIGSGSDMFGSDSIVNIYGGTINSFGGANGAGIGSGYESYSEINIYDGTIYAVGSEFGAGIGSGLNADAIVNISGGDITVSRQGSAAGAKIGSGCQANATVILTGSNISMNIVGAGEMGNCKIYDYRNGNNNGTATLLSNGSVIIISIIGCIALITAGIFIVLYIREKKKG